MACDPPARRLTITYGASASLGVITPVLQACPSTPSLPFQHHLLQATEMGGSNASLLGTDSLPLLRCPL